MVCSRWRKPWTFSITMHVLFIGLYHLRLNLIYSLSLFNYQPCGNDNLCKLEFHIYLCSLLFSPSCSEEKHSGFLGFILRLDHQERTTLLDIKIIYYFRCFYNLVFSGSLLLTNALEFLGCLCILHKHNYFMSANDIKCL